MATGILDIVKQTALNAVNNAKMCDLRYGKVVSVSPLKVQITSQFTIPEALLVVPNHLTNRYVNVNIDNQDKTMYIMDALKVGDKVALLRKQGGQSYFILDRI